MPEQPDSKESSKCHDPSLPSAVSQGGGRCCAAVPESSAIVVDGIIIVFFPQFFVVVEEARYSEASCSSSGHWAVVIWRYTTSCMGSIRWGGGWDSAIEYSSMGDGVWV